MKIIIYVFFKMHTTYVAGVRSSDRHIEYFWNTLESFSKASVISISSSLSYVVVANKLVFFQEQQGKFIKFACNQERLPGRCSCQDGVSDVHVPPYPMKIGPPDGRGRKKRTLCLLYFWKK